MITEIPRTAPDEKIERPSTGLLVAAVLAQLGGLAIAGWCLFMAWIVTYGLFSSSTPAVDPSIVLPLLGITLATPLGALVMSTGPDRRRWLIAAAVIAAVSLVTASLLTWLPVALGVR